MRISEIITEENNIKSFSDYNPIAVFLYYMCVTVPVMFCQNPVLTGLALISGAFYLFVRSGWKGLRGALWMFAVPFIGLLINPLFNHNGATILFVMNDNPITKEAALFGLASGIMIAAVLLWFATFTDIMTSDKLLYVFGSVSPKLALILSMTLRYIPLFKKQIAKTNNAQKAMGLYKEDNAIDKVKGGMRIFSVMVTWALENGVITADSMTARGYGTGKRSRFAIFKWTKQDTALLAVSAALCIFTLTAMIKGSLNFEWYPYIVPAKDGWMTTAAYISFGLLSLLPDYLQIKEETRWKSLQSKI